MQAGLQGFVYSSPALSNPFATRHMWRMAVLMWRMTLFPNNSKFEFFIRYIYQIQFTRPCQKQLKWEEGWPRILVFYDICRRSIPWHLKAWWTLWCVFKMWRMDIFIRHNCGKSENVVGHRWTKVYFKSFSVISMCLIQCTYIALVWLMLKI